MHKECCLAFVESNSTLTPLIELLTTTTSFRALHLHSLPPECFHNLILLLLIEKLNDNDSISIQIFQFSILNKEWERELQMNFQSPANRKESELILWFIQIEVLPITNVILNGRKALNLKPEWRQF